MRERPILFSAPMVQAILDGRKTQTRRIVKPAVDAYVNELHGSELAKRAPYEIEPEDGFHPSIGFGFSDDRSGIWRSPYGRPGDQLWVRETWAATCALDEDKPTDLSPDHDYWYRADDPSDDRIGRWRPSIHMPRWASRIDLLVTGVRVQKLQDISEEDAKAEGLRGP